MKHLIATAIIMTIFACSPNEQAKQQEIKVIGENSYKLVLEDDFESPQLDTTIWDYRTDCKHWSVQEPSNVEVKDGNLILHLTKQQRDTFNYAGAGIISKDKFMYGYYETSVKIPKGSGWHTSFWLMTHDGSGGTNIDSATIELDIMENDSKDSAGYHVNFHKWIGGHKDYGWEHIEAPNLTNDFQKLACAFTPEYAVYYLNDKEVKQIDISSVPHSALNIWLTTIASWLSDTENVDETYLPSIAQFEYVKYYELTTK